MSTTRTIPDQINYLELSESLVNRNAWCTPKWLTDLLPAVDLDPCSNSRSTVRATTTYSLDAGQDGLALPWEGVVYCNPPYDSIVPWVEKLRASQGSVVACGFLVNHDESTQWWQKLSQSLDMKLAFKKRIKFDPPPGVIASSNNKPQALLCDRDFLRLCDPKIFEHATLWLRGSL